MDVDHGGENRTNPRPRRCGCQLTLDPNTANRKLSLSEGNRRMTHTPGREEQPYPDGPTSFDHWLQVLSRESVCERCYWEAEFSVVEMGREVEIAVTDIGIPRRGHNFVSVFLYYENAWCLQFRNGGPGDKPQRYIFCHKGNRTDIPVPPSPYRREEVGDAGARREVCVYRVGVYVDRPASILSFYSVSDSDTLTLLHTTHIHVTQHTHLYAGFAMWGTSSLSLCQLE